MFCRKTKRSGLWIVGPAFLDSQARDSTRVLTIGRATRMRRPRSQEAALQSTRCAARLGIRPQPHFAVCRAAGASGGRTLCAVGGARLGPRCCSSQQPAPARRCSSCGRAARLARRATRPPPPTTTTTNDDDDDDDTNTHTPRVWLGASGASPPTTGSTTAAAGSMPIDSHTKTRSSAASFQFSERA